MEPTASRLPSSSWWLVTPGPITAAETAEMATKIQKTSHRPIRSPNRSQHNHEYQGGLNGTDDGHVDNARELEAQDMAMSAARNTPPSHDTQNCCQLNLRLDAYTTTERSAAPSHKR